jgi:hypothetical protein
VVAPSAPNIGLSRYKWTFIEKTQNVKYNYYDVTLFLSKLLRIIAAIITPPPISTLKGGISFKNNHTHKGANVVSVNIKRPIVAEAVVRDPMVIQINPKAN